MISLVKLYELHKPSLGGPRSQKPNFLKLVPRTARPKLLKLLDSYNLFVSCYVFDNGLPTCAVCSTTITDLSRGYIPETCSFFL